MSILDKTQKITFSIDEYSLKEISDSQLMELEMKVVSEGDNKHGMPITRDAVINSAETIIGKPVLFKFNSSTQDLMEHEVDEIACGVCALTKDDYYFKEIDGKLWLIVKAYIWKIYFEDVVKVFNRDKEKAISMEMFIVDSEKTEDDETLETIKSFCFSAVTLLGKIYTPAIPNADAKVIKYTKETFSTMIDETKKLLFFKNKLDDTTNDNEKEAKTLDKFNKKEFAKKYSLTANELFEKFETKLMEVTYKEDSYDYRKYRCRDYSSNYVFVRDNEKECHMAIPYSITKKDISLDYENAKSCRMTYVIDEEEDEETDDLTQVYYEKEVSEKVQEEVSKTEAEYASKVEDLEKEKSELTTSVATYTTEKEELDNKIKTYQEETEALKNERDNLAEFKASIEKQDRLNKISYAIQSVKDALTEEQIIEWESKVDEFETIDSYTNAIQAFAYTQVKEIPKDDQTIRIHIPHNKTEDTKKGLWD